MKILVVIPSVGSVYGGPSKSVVELTKAIGIQGIEVDIVTTTANGDHQLDVPLLTWIRENEYRIQYFPYISQGDYKFSFKLTKWLYAHVKDYNLVHTNAIFSLTNIPAYWACQKYNIPYLITPRGMLQSWALSYKAGKKKIYYSLLEKPAINRSNGIQILATAEKDEVQALNLKPPLFIIPNGVNKENFENLPSSSLFLEQFPEAKNKQLILFLGRIDPKKGLDLLAPAFANVHQKFSNIHLIIAGPDNVGYLTTAKKYFQDLDCLSAVTFTGILTGEIKYSALSAANIYVAPSYSEGFSMSILEGMASGLPCIFTTGCNFPEAGEANAAYVVDINSGSIEKALITCLENPEEAKKMGDRAKEFIFDNYTWDKIAKKLIKVYQKIINERYTKKMS
ncbi:glycosyltransferase [Geminocystis sp. NIES-3708]|uniref:glycosyltransferase n=1 Tax=Geminocystis sp. NIES-3708 TaxID=1615909 RepID=UPI0005FCB556|nr:glycosyltransferase [Geminocystis sp. NIES-3708]BAQ60092.1 glycosyltransferase [Geminocystis sp. NIES-3708]